MLGVLSLCAVVEDVLSASRSARASASHRSRRVPRCSKYRSTELLSSLSRGNSIVPRVLLVAYEDSENSESELIRAVAECCLYLLRSHITCGVCGEVYALPLGVVHTAEAAYPLIGLVRVDGAGACRIRVKLLCECAFGHYGKR